MRTRTLVVLALLLVVSRPAHAANLIVNGGFEVAPDPGAGTMLVAAGSNALAPWVVTAGDVEDVGPNYWEPASGLCSLALNGNTAGTIAQSFPTVSGATYDVTFSLSGDAFSTPAVKHVRVGAAGQSHDQAFDTTPAWPWDMGWARITWSFQAVASTTTLTFQSLDAGNTGPAIDSVSVVLTGPLDAGTPVVGLALDAIAPNPASGDVRITWSLPRAAHARLIAYDVRGRIVAMPFDGEFSAGPHATTLDTRRLAPGVMLLKLEALGEVRTQRMAVVR